MADTKGNTVDWAARRAKTQLNMQKLFAPLVNTKTTTMAESFMENDATVYTDVERFEREKSEIFQNTPLLACLSVDLPESGDKLIFNDAGPSVLIVRNAEGKVNAFLNMCMHRGAKLVTECKRSKLMTCPFHAWSFDLNGELIAIPGDEGFTGLDRSKRKLVSVPCVEWGGCVFVIARAGDDEIDIEAFLGSFADELLQLEVDKAEFVKSGLLEAKSNWKYALDTYGEGYHFASLHPETVSQISMTNTSSYEQFGDHHRLGFPPHSVKEWAHKPESEWPTESFGAVHYLFPNTVIFFGSLSEGLSFLQIFRLFPGDSVGELKTQFSVYAPFGVTSEENREGVETLGYDATAHVVLTEDYWISSESWARLKDAPKGFKVLYGANEPALQKQHKSIAKAIGMPLGG